MPRTVTIEVPDEFLPQLDRVLFRWTKPGEPPEWTLFNMLMHGLEVMDVPDPAEADIGDEAIPF